jgi:hypothetical protein
MVDVKTLMSQLLQQLSVLHGQSFRGAKTQQDLQRAIYNFGQLIAHYNRALAAATSNVVTQSSVTDLAKFADYLDDNGFHALADKVDSITKLLPHKQAATDIKVVQAVKNLSEVYDRMRNNTITHANDPKFLVKVIREDLRGPFAEALNFLINYFNVGVSALDGEAFASSEGMLKIADSLDRRGLSDLADIVDESALIMQRSADYGFFPKHKKQEIVEGDAAPVQMPHEGSLSTRYCPDHRGTQAIRIGEHMYQCPIDGKKYNYETGYVNYEGQRVPGGSVAAQTPTTSDYGGIPMRIYDSRSDVLNRLN